MVLRQHLHHAPVPVQGWHQCPPPCTERFNFPKPGVGGGDVCISREPPVAASELKPGGDQHRGGHGGFCRSDGEAEVHDLR
jgi:hypothetical protein